MKRAFTIGLLLALPLCSMAQTLEACIAKARDNYPEIRRHDLIRHSRDYNVSNAIRGWLPQVKLSAQASWQNEVPEMPDAMNRMLAGSGTPMEGMQHDQYHVALSVTQPLWDGGASASARRLAEAQADVAQKQSEVTLYALEERVEEIYFAILLLDKRAEQLQQTLGLLESNLRKVEAMQKHGTAMASDQDVIRAEWLTARQSLEQTGSTRRSYRRMLSYLVGSELEDSLTVPAEVRVSSLQPARPELAMLGARKSMFEAEKSRLNADLRPRFSFFADCQYGYPGYDLFRSMQRSNWRLNAMFGLRMTWQLGALYTRQNDLRKIAVAQRQVDVDQDIFLFDTHLKTMAEHEEITHLKKMLDSDRDILRLRQQVRQANESKYENGVTDVHTLTRAITDENQAALALTARRIELLQTQYRLKRTLNR